MIVGPCQRVIPWGL